MKRRFVRLAQSAALLAGLALFFLFTAAPGGGGRGGGGGLGGGFGGGGFGGASARFHSRNRAGGRTSWAVGLAFVAVSGAALYCGLRAGRGRVVQLVFMLRDGSRYLPELDALLIGSDFTDPQARAQALNKLARTIDPGDIQDAFIDASATSTHADHAAMRLYYAQVARAGIRSEPVRAHSQHPSRAEDNGSESWCVLGIVLTAADRLLHASEDRSDAIAALKLLREDWVVPGALYIYYSPDPGESLDATAAMRMFSLLRAGAAD